jgi:hypothetical protein
MDAIKRLHCSCSKLLARRRTARPLGAQLEATKSNENLDRKAFGHKKLRLSRMLSRRDRHNSFISYAIHRFPAFSDPIH